MNKYTREIHIMSGPPASGKSTFIDSIFRRTPAITALHRDIFRDNLRRFYNSIEYFPVSAQKEFQLWTSFINDALIHTPMFDVYIDQTTLNLKSFTHLYNALEIRSEDKVIIDVFPTPLSLCLHRNSLRSGRAHVPPETLSEMYSKFEIINVPYAETRIHSLSDEDICTEYWEISNDY